MNRNDIYTAYMYSYPHKTAYRSLNQTEFDRTMLSTEHHLYFHIPFCESKCGYCNLFSVSGHNQDYYRQYLAAMQDHIQQYGLDHQQVMGWKSFTVGGGTPLVLSTELLDMLFDMAQDIGISHDTYRCIETAPKQTTKEKLELLKQYQVDRVSIGVQSFCDEELQALHRSHDAAAVTAALKLLKDADFPCLNMDLIYGIRNQTISSVQYSLDQMLYYEPEEVFVYPLYVRDGTLLHQKAQHGSITHEHTYDFYLYIRDYLIAHGYYQMSMRRFVKKLPEIEVNCGFEDMISIGCGGRSYLGNLHFCTPYQTSPSLCRKEIEMYIQNPDKRNIQHGYLLNEEEQKRRFVIKNLLYHRGIHLATYEATFGSNLVADFPEFNELTNQQYCTAEYGWFRLTPLGLSLSDDIGPMFISAQVRKEMREYYE